MGRLIVHVAEVNLSEESGMGRIAYYWKKQFEKRGYEFLHIGPAEVGSLRHPALFPDAAHRIYKQLGRKASIFLVHEPASGSFLKFGIPTVLFSHGLERRGWELQLQAKEGTTEKLKWRTKILFPLWRLRQCDLGLSKTNLLLLSNQQDVDFAQKYYCRDAKHSYVFKNGVFPSALDEKTQPLEPLTVLFLGTWTKRKGIRTLTEAAQILQSEGFYANWLLAGTGLDSETVLKDWSEEIRPFVEVIPRFHRDAESNLFARANVFVLPSFFEGQPLALLQAMESGRCCITTNCCGQRDLIKNGYNGLLHEPGDAQTLAALIQDCAKNKDLRTTLGKNAKQSVSDRSWEVTSAEVVDQIEEVLSQYCEVKC
ncbi:glycosyltransferase family 4 protein [Tolypothrix campylonemoides VB511288]|nr:glycosyltransferase family 4 protein [Tolypothrix campylonemoides VB511288]